MSVPRNTPELPGLPSLASGAPLEDISSLIVGPGIDDLPRRAARRVPGRPAFLTDGGALTYAELDAQVSRCAAALREMLGHSGAIVAVAGVLAPVFAVAFYGIARSGNISTVVNPLLRTDGLEHVLRASRAKVAIMTPELWERLVPIRNRLPALEHVVLTSAAPDTEGMPVLADLATRNSGGQPSVPGGDAGQVACIMFTSGTTGAPKGVPLSHRNLAVNAAQTARAQDLDDTAVMLNYLPTFHLMHLNAAVCAAITQVLHLDGDVVTSVEVANRHRVTHYYSLPMRLSRLAADPRLPGLALPSARALLSGGSALPPPVAAALSAHFGVPAVQGYGLAEASPLTHFNRISDPRPGSCGGPVPGTDCRVVDIGTREVLPVGRIGEIEVRGPQLMAGYLDPGLGAGIGGDGWFATGDVGRFDADGRMFLTDRIKDVFKCDNFLVSPAEVEQALRKHPAVADCAVVDCPDEFSGAVAYGIVVLRETTADPGEIMRTVNKGLPYFMRLRGLDPVSEIPRSPYGKLMRREIRDQVRHRVRTGS